MESMPEFSLEREGEFQSIVAVAVSGSRDGMYPLKWAVENLVSIGSSLHLIHVYPPIKTIPKLQCRPGRSMPKDVGDIPLDEVSHHVRDQVKQLREMELGLIKMKKYKLCCKEREVKPTLSLFPSESIGESLVDHIAQLGISKIVIGNGSRWNMSGPAEYVQSHLRSFCEVLAICRHGRVLRGMGENQSSSLTIPRTLKYDARSGRYATADCTEAIKSLIESIEHSPNNVHLQAVKQDTRLVVVSDRETLGQQLNSAARELREQMSGLERVEATLLNAKRMVEEYNLQREEETRLKEEALKELEIEKNRCSQARMKQEELEQILQATKMKKTKLRLLLYQKTILFGEGATALSESRKETELAQKRVASLLSDLTTRSNEIATCLVELENTKKALEMEMQLRENAEEKAQQELESMQEMMFAWRESHKTYTKYGFEEIQEATNNFSEALKIGRGGSSSVYKGTIQYMIVAVKVLQQTGLQGSPELQHEVELLSRIRHPHVVMLLGACPEKGCIVYEYMTNGSLEDCLAQRPHDLPWYIRFRICYEVAVALMFLHSSQPEPIIHCDLKPSNVLLDHNFSCKISNVGMARLIPNNMELMGIPRTDSMDDLLLPSHLQYQSTTEMFTQQNDVYALGIVILQVLTGLPPVGITGIIDAALQNDGLSAILDRNAGDWPIPEALELSLMGLQCASSRIDIASVLSFLQQIQRLADMAIADEGRKRASPSVSEPEVPNIYICPITQLVMKEPHIAADGYTYEYEQINSWLQNHNTSPMTNVCMDHRNLIPNRSLKSAIQDWKSKAGPSSEER